MGLLAREELPIARLSDGQALDFGATATHSGAAMTAKYIAVNASAAVCFIFGNLTATAVATHMRISADQTVYLKCSTADYLHVIAADSAATGVLGKVRWADLVG